MPETAILMSRGKILGKWILLASEQIQLRLILHILDWNTVYLNKNHRRGETKQIKKFLLSSTVGRLRNEIKPRCEKIKKFKIPIFTAPLHGHKKVYIKKRK